MSSRSISNSPSNILQDEDLENLVEGAAATGAAAAAAAPETKEKAAQPMEDPKSRQEIKSSLAKNIHRVLFDKSLPERNELFAPGRMAYVVDLEVS